MGYVVEYLILILIIDLSILSTFVVLMTAFAPVFKWKRKRVFFISLFIAILAFFPSCNLIDTTIDKQINGIFEYATIDEMKQRQHPLDIRSYDYFLPPQAKEITIYKSGVGHNAVYSISQDDLLNHVNSIWQSYCRYDRFAENDEECKKLLDGKNIFETSPAKHSETQKTPSRTSVFKKVGLPAPNMNVVIVYTLPFFGGFATYNFDPTTQTVYESVAYW